MRPCMEGKSHLSSSALSQPVLLGDIEGEEHGGAG